MRDESKGDILIVDDEPNAIKILAAILSRDGYNVLGAKDVESAIMIVRQKNVDAVITDLKMPGKDGIQLFEYIAENYSDVPVIFLTAYGTVESAVSAITAGVHYYFIKPPDYVKLKSILSRAVERRRLRSEVGLLKQKITDENSKRFIIGKTPGMQKIFRTIEAVKDSSSSVLICGETGTGKELVARTLHYHSGRREKPFITVNCAAMPRELIESELFGYEKGAFTNALSMRIGRFEEAAGGTVFLDEIGELDLPLQSKLLRVLQEREIERLGSNKKIKVEFRLVSSTNRDLETEVKNKNFREDLFYRLNVVRICMPPLRERMDDLPLFVSEFVKEFCIREKKLLTVSDEVMKAFQDYHWPGNIRQLRNMIERAVVLAKGKEITAKELPEELSPLSEKRGLEELRRLGGRREPIQSARTLKEIEIQAIEEALRKCHGNKSMAARTLGISRKAFYKRLRESNISHIVSGENELTSQEINKEAEKPWDKKQASRL